MVNLENEKKIRVLLADGCEVIHWGIKEALTKAKKNVWIDSAYNESQVLECISKFSYDLIILDFFYINAEMFKLIENVLKNDKFQKILVFSNINEETYGMRLIKLGVKGFLAKNDCRVDELFEAISMIVNGERYLSIKLKTLFATEYLEGNGVKGIGSLTARELQILQYLMSGMRSKEIQEKLNLHPSTIGTHKLRIFRKLDVNNIIELQQKYYLNNQNIVAI